MALPNLPVAPVTFSRQESPACWNAAPSIPGMEKDRERWPCGGGISCPLAAHPFRALHSPALAPSPKSSTLGNLGEMHCRVWGEEGQGWQQKKKRLSEPGPELIALLSRGKELLAALFSTAAWRTGPVGSSRPRRKAHGRVTPLEGSLSPTHPQFHQTRSGSQAGLPTQLVQSGKTPSLVKTHLHPGPQQRPA